MWHEVIPAAQDMSLDILNYWKGMEPTLPLLASIAKATFAIQITSASSERVFSEGGNVVTKSRTLLDTDNAEMLVYIHDNYEKVLPFISKFKTNIKDFSYEDQEPVTIDSSDEEEEMEQESRSLLVCSQSMTSSQSQTEPPNGMGRGKDKSKANKRARAEQDPDDVEIMGGEEDE